MFFDPTFGGADDLKSDLRGHLRPQKCKMAKTPFKKFFKITFDFNMIKNLKSWKT